jgi:tyrosine-protein phosphatase YwqE
MLSFFNIDFFKSQTAEPPVIITDMHSHILPGIDDGAATLEESLLIINKLMNLGYKKLIATPHVMSDYYRNTPDIIYRALAEVQEAVAEKGWDIEVAAAAEYYLDEYFIEMLKKNQTLLTFGSRYLLFETPFINEPACMTEAVFLMQSSNYQPVLAHPERYLYLQQNFSKCVELVNNGVLLQINLNSLSGAYSLPAQLLAEKLIDNGMVSFAGTDCHAFKQTKLLETSRTKKYYHKLADANLLNQIL